MMSLNARIVDPANGEIDQEGFSAKLGEEEHQILAALVKMNLELFPLLVRLERLDAVVIYVAAELENLIAELERAAWLAGCNSRLLDFTGPFHSLCSMALCNEKNVALRPVD